MVRTSEAGPENIFLAANIQALIVYLKVNKYINITFNIDKVS